MDSGKLSILISFDVEAHQHQWRLFYYLFFERTFCEKKMFYCYSYAFLYKFLLDYSIICYWVQFVFWSSINLWCVFLALLFIHLNKQVSIKVLIILGTFSMKFLIFGPINKEVYVNVLKLRMIICLFIFI